MNSETWKDVIAVLTETAKGITQSAVLADTDAEAQRLILEARVATKLVESFTIAVETTAQHSGE